jgi:hypothetical protein
MGLALQAGARQVVLLCGNDTWPDIQRTASSSDAMTPGTTTAPPSVENCGNSKSTGGISNAAASTNTSATSILPDRTSDSIFAVAPRLIG